MSKPRKLRIPRDGRPLPELTRLKQLVTEMSRAEADELWERSESLSCVDWRAYVARTHGINLKSDRQVTDYRNWFQDFLDLQDFNSAMERDEAELANSGKSAEEIRELVIRKAYARAEAKRDSKLSMQVMDRDLSVADARRKEKELALKSEALAQAERKLKLLEEKERAAQQAKEQLTSLAKAGANAGLTPEALRQIEEAAALL